MWQLLILSLPTRNATARMRAWRSLKACGAAVVRDGVYALPDRPELAQTLAGIAADVDAHGGTTWQFSAKGDAARLTLLFSRDLEFAELLVQIGRLQQSIGPTALPADLVRQAKRLRKTFEQISAIDHFPGEAQRQAGAALDDVEKAVRLAVEPDEPRSITAPLLRLDRKRYQNRIWATRERPGVDRLASAWLIRRFIDPQATFVWLKPPAVCPRRAVGFDFDGAEFTHVGSRVTFEHLLVSFGLGSPALDRIGLLVHHLDAGGAQPPEASGVERVLAGMRQAIADDDQLLLAAAGVFEGLLVAFEKELSP